MHNLSLPSVMRQPRYLSGIILIIVGLILTLIGFFKPWVTMTFPDNPAGTNTMSPAKLMGMCGVGFLGALLLLFLLGSVVASVRARNSQSLLPVLRYCAGALLVFAILSGLLGMAGYWNDAPATYTYYPTPWIAFAGCVTALIAVKTLSV